MKIEKCKMWGRHGWGACLLVLAVEAAFADEPKVPNAARSVHLGFPAPDATVFYNEVTVEESVPGSYFMVCGFKHGYFGIQELSGPEDKVVLFSIWDPGEQNDPNSVPADRRVEVLHNDNDARRPLRQRGDRSAVVLQIEVEDRADVSLLREGHGRETENVVRRVPVAR